MNVIAGIESNEEAKKTEGKTGRDG